MKFYIYLNELFDTKVEIKFYEYGNLCTYAFKINNKWYEVSIKETDIGAWSIAFSDELGSMEITGKGDSDTFKIFAGVIKSIKIFIKNKKPKIIYFTAKEVSRKKLYDRFAQMLVKETKFKLVNNVMIKAFIEKYNIKEKLYLFWVK